MSIVHIFVCDLCGNQLQLENPNDIGYDEKEDFPQLTSALNAFEEKKEEKEPAAYYSVSLDWSGETKYFHNHSAKKSNWKSFSFCDKDCFVEYLQKFMTDKGHFNKNPNAKYVEGK